jgi:hypothetical protein
LAHGVLLLSSTERRPDGTSIGISDSESPIASPVAGSKRSSLMNAPAHAIGSADAYRSLTRTDLILCVLPIALFLSIVSFV